MCVCPLLSVLMTQTGKYKNHTGRRAAMKELKHLIYFESLLEDTNNELVRKAES